MLRIGSTPASTSIRHAASCSHVTHMETTRGAQAPHSRIRVSGKVKTFVLDTNVLLHDPQSIFKFEDNNLAIPVEVLEELDAIKGEQSTERGRSARRVHRILQELLPDTRSMHEGVELETGGTLSIIINPYLTDACCVPTRARRCRRAILATTWSVGSGSRIS